MKICAQVVLLENNESFFMTLGIRFLNSKDREVYGTPEDLRSMRHFLLRIKKRWTKIYLKNVKVCN